MNAPHGLYGKKLLPLSILLLLTLSLLSTVNVSIIRVSAVESPAIMVVPESTVDAKLTPGKNYTVSIYTDYDGSDVTSYQLVLSYNPDVLHGGISNKDTWTGDNSKTLFYTTRTPVVPESERVYVNKTLMDRDFNYTINYVTGEIGFIKTAPGFGAEIEATYLYDGVTNGDLIVGGSARFKAGPFNNTAGKLSLTVGFYFEEGEVTAGPGTLASVTFRVVGIGSSNITIDPETKLIGWDEWGGKEYYIIDAETMPTHIQHGYFKNKLTGSIVGKVTNASSGDPISGAIVTAVGPQTCSTSTAEDGTYSLDEVLVGDYTISASADGYHGDSKPATVIQDVTTLDFALTPISNPAWISGRVTDAKTGSAIVGATVTANGFMGFTNETGYYSIMVEALEKYTVTASMPRYYDDVKTGVSVPAGATTTVNFSLQPIVGSIDGTVKDASTGGSIQGAKVTAGDYSATTDDSGYYLIADVQVGTYNVTASATRYYSYSKPATVTENATTALNFKLEPLPGAINGTVIDKATNLPIAGATVMTTPGNYSGTTDASGTYLIADVPAGTAGKIKASANGYFYSILSFVVTSGNTTTVNFKLTRMKHDVGFTELTVPAEVTKGENVTVSLSLSNRGNYEETFTLTVVVKETGTTILERTMTLGINGYTTETVDFDTSALEPGTYTIRAEAKLATDYDPKSIWKEAKITIKPKTGSIAGTVTDASTELPISGATVTAVGPENRSTSTAEDGTYSLDEVPVGDYTVTASADGYHSDSKPATVIENTTTTVDLALTALPGTIAGTVSDSSTGTPIAGATVTVDGTSATTDISGAYTISDLPAGTYTVTVSADGYQSSSQAGIIVIPGETTIVDFELTPVHPLNLLLCAGAAAILIIATAAIAVYKLRKPKPA